MSKGRTKGNRKGGRKGDGLGRSLVKDRNRTSSKHSVEGWRHTSDLEDGYEWGRLNLRSVTEESNLDEFLHTAELAGIEFKAERLNIKLVDPTTHTGLPTLEQRAETKKAEEENAQYLSIPRRPAWDSSTTAEELEQRERESFLEWRRSLARLQEDDRLILTPFERNLEFWRQLWRVVERSDVLVQIVDARNPLLFRCEDLEKYALEVDPKKVNMLLISKADLLSPLQRQAWADYFQRDTSIIVAFWSALMETQDTDTAHAKSDTPDPDATDTKSDTMETPDPDATGTKSDTMETLSPDLTPLSEHPMEGVGESEEKTCPETQGRSEGGMEVAREEESREELDTQVGMEGTERGREDVSKKNSEEGGEEAEGTKLLTREQLIELFRAVSSVPPGSLTTVGMVGYPNVGKSSTINALFQGKKVPVSATPGRTKHFQTLYLSSDLMLCDCPGLVFPSFLSSKAEMVCSGILPIDQLRDHTPPVSLVCERIPRPILERTYGIEIPPPGEGEDQHRPPLAHELLSCYGYMRGFMTNHGRPDEPRSSRYILKDYVNGKLLYCHPPPNLEDDKTFNHQFLHPDTAPSSPAKGAKKEKESHQPKSPVKLGEFDSHYFQKGQVQAITKGGAPRGISSAAQGPSEGKPWKKHNNKHKKEKTRRIHPNF